MNIPARNKKVSLPEPKHAPKEIEIQIEKEDNKDCLKKLCKKVQRLTD